MQEEEKSNIDNLKDKLYSREYSPEKKERSGISPHKFEGINTDWDNKSKKKSLLKEKGDDFIKWFLFVSIAFFVVASAISAFIFIRGSVNVSARNVDVRVIGPVAIGGGEDLSLEIVIDNKNNVTMETTNVYVEYPEGTRVKSSLDEELLRDYKEYGSISPGRNKRETFESVLFGEQDSVKEIRVRVEYRVTGSSATFEKEKTYEIKISSSPVLVKVDYPNEVRSGQELEFRIEVASNSKTDLSDVMLSAEYPFGFSFKESSPEVTYDTDAWLIGTLKPEEKKIFTIRGVLSGQDNEERTFRFNVGTQNREEEKALGATYVASANTIAITKPGLSTRATINGSSSDKVILSAGDNVQTVISWINSLQTRITDASITAYIDGNMVDAGSISVSSGGFFRSSDNSISWNYNSRSDLKEIPESDGSAVDFGFKILDLNTNLASTLRNPKIDIVIGMEGTKDASDKVDTTLSKQILVESNLLLDAEVVRDIGPIENSGPIPPVAEDTTTYTVKWSLKNSFNDVSNVQVVGQLPSYIDWDGVSLPGSENITFNQSTKQVIWTIPNIKAGTGFSGLSKEVYFRISLTPSASQSGSRPVILQQITAKGTDQFTSTVVSDGADNLTTLFTGATQAEAEVQ
ncbi:MAG: hypothetical protein MRY49_03540 [Candidatus Pacebacteria bacterium]|nr:hypothetical protein [Candidatus Paceibacterota bacterium]